MLYGELCDMSFSRCLARVGGGFLLALAWNLCSVTTALQVRQTGNATTTVSSPASITFGSGTTPHSTTSFDVASASTYLPNTDYSNEQLNFLWDQVGA